MRVNYIYVVLVFLVSFMSCEAVQDVKLVEKVEHDSQGILEILSSLGWTIEDEGNISERANYCQLGDAEPFPCDGGNCIGVHGYVGNDFCVVCDGGANAGDAGCVGAMVEDVLDNINEYNPAAKINYKVHNDEDHVMFEGGGVLSEVLEDINQITNDYPNLMLTFEIDQ